MNGGECMIKIKKVLNSSVVLAEDANKKEFILLGKGIGYNRKQGEELKEDHAQYQQFIPVSNTKSLQIAEMLGSITEEVLEVTSEVIQLAKKELSTSFNDNLYFLMADHLNFAIERFQKNMVITNRLSWEIQNFYPQEYQVALECLNYINERLKISLSEDEAVNIAFHLVNAQATNNPEYDSARYSKLIGDIVSLVRYSLNKDFNKDSIHYLRFVTHIRFFVERFFTGKMLEDTEHNFYMNQKSVYHKEAEVANKIKNFLYDKYQMLITDEEMSFLIIHINRLMRE